MLKESTLKQSLLKTGSIVFMLAAASSAIAEPIKGNVDFGWVATSGNSETTNLNAQLGLEKETENWKHTANFSAVNSSSEDSNGNDNTSAEKYAAKLQSDRNLSDRSYVYVKADYLDDRFSAFDYQANAGLGFGYKLIAEENMTLQFEVGPNYSKSKSQDTSETTEETSYSVGEGFTWKFSDTAELVQYATYYAGDEVNTLKFGGFVASKLSDALSLKVGVEAIKIGGDQQDAAELAAELAGNEIDDTDTTTYANVSYSF